jgi:hypothetical protein
MSVGWVPPICNVPPLPWQWFHWRWPIWRHQFSTRTIWKPGNVPFRLRAWQPDITGRTLHRFSYDSLNWAVRRGVRPNNFAFDMNTGSVVWTTTGGLIGQGADGGNECNTRNFGDARNSGSFMGL